MRRTILAGALSLIVSLTWTANVPASAQANQEWPMCPDSTSIDPRDNRAVADDGDDQPAGVAGPRMPALTVRLRAPKAGATTSADLAAQASLAALVYRMYDVDDAGEDPWRVLPPEWQRIALVYGNSGRDTERPQRRARDTRTFYGFIADESATGRRVIVFRGTLQPVEWLRNLQAGQRPYPSGARRFQALASVHAGFLMIFDSLKVEMEGRRSRFADALPALVGDRKTTVIGHSLGAALATLAAVDAARRVPAQAAALRLVTFASPRVGDPRFAALAASLGRIDRVCNIVDLVPAVPPSTRRVT